MKTTPYILARARRRAGYYLAAFAAGASWLIVFFYAGWRLAGM